MCLLPEICGRPTKKHDSYSQLFTKPAHKDREKGEGVRGGGVGVSRRICKVY